MSDLHFSLCKDSEIDELVSFVNGAYRGESSKLGWTTEEALLDGQRTDRDMLRELSQREGQEIWTARDKRSRLVGLFHLERAGDRAFVGMLTVDPQRQSQGLGRQLIRAAEERVKKQWGFSEIFMTVISLRKELIEYYQRRGFLPTQEIKDFPMQDPRYGIPKRNDFHLMVLRKSLR